MPMKVSELALALKELGTVFRHSSENQPADCINKVLNLIEGKEDLEVGQLIRAMREAGAKKPRYVAPANPKTPFEVAPHVAALKRAVNAGNFAEVKRDLERARPTKQDLCEILEDYAGLSLKRAKKDELWAALDKAYAGKQRGANRAEIAGSELPL